MPDVPYYAPEQPEVPKNTGSEVARIVASADLGGMFLRGFAGAAQAATARERARLESEQMITDAAMKSRELDIARENNVLDFKVGMKNAESYENYRDALAGIESDPTNPSSKAGRRNIARQRMETFADFNKRMAAYGLLEPNPKNPVEFYANYKKLNDEFAFADDMSEIKNALTTIKTRTEQHTVPLRQGMKLDEKKNAWVATGESKPVPVGQIVENLSDPDKTDAMMSVLQRNGLATEEVKKVFLSEEGKPFVNRDYVRDWLFGKRTEVKTKTLSPSFGRYMEMSKGVDFSRGKARTPAAGVLPADTGTATSSPSVTQADVDEADAALATERGESVSTPPDLFPPTATDQIVMQAKRAAAKPGANIDGIKAALQAKGIDPTLLDQ